MSSKQLIQDAIILGVQQCNLCSRYIKGRIIYDNEQYSWLSLGTSSAKYGGNFCGSYCCNSYVKMRKNQEKEKNQKLLKIF
tara:strand:- start:957 stop:1199 length:243 start_codon:yes stop_codon:yes gene_type:complete